MSTRGVIGVRIDGQDKLTYNHSDSYPTGLGDDLAEELKLAIHEFGLDELAQLAHDLKMVNDNEQKPTKAEIKKLQKWMDTGVSTGKPTEWYVLLRHLQGELITTLKVGYMLNSANFINSSLFCEWGYIVNFDTQELEVYRGFQRQRHDKGRYATKTPPQKADGNGSDYWPCALLATFPLTKPFPKGWAQKLEKQVESEGG